MTLSDLEGIFKMIILARARLEAELSHALSYVLRKDRRTIVFQMFIIVTYYYNLRNVTFYLILTPLISLIFMKFSKPVRISALLVCNFFGLFFLMQRSKF